MSVIVVMLVHICLGLISNSFWSSSVMFIFFALVFVCVGGLLARLFLLVLCSIRRFHGRVFRVHGLVRISITPLPT